MKKKFIIFTLCFTLIFSSLNCKKSYADGGIISLPMLATVSALAVSTGLIINGTDDLYDIGRIFYEKNKSNWESVKAVFVSSVAFNSTLNKYKVGKSFLDIVKNTFDSTFSDVSDDIYIDTPFGVLSGYGHQAYEDKLVFNFGSNLTLKFNDYSSYSSYNRYRLSYTYTNYEGKTSSGNTTFVDLSFPGRNVEFVTSFDGRYLIATPFGDTKLHGTSTGKFDLISFLHSRGVNVSDLSFTYFPYQGTYNPGNVLDNDIDISIPNNLGDLVGDVNPGYVTGALNPPWSVGGTVSLPGVNNPSIDVDDSISFPLVGDPSVPGVDSPSVPNEGIWSTIKDFIISLVVPNDAFWTDTWGGLYNNFTDSFPMVDMSGFNDLVTGEKKFPNIDINVMGVTGRVVNGDIINSIVDWLRPIIAGFMMICLMLFNYRKIYKLIRNTEPFGGIAPGTSDFKTGISEYTHVGLVNDGFKRSEEEEFARSRYYEEMHFRNGGKL